MTQTIFFSKKQSTAFLAALALTGSMLSLKAATFNGSSSIWDLSSSWSTAAVPGLADDVVFNGTGTATNVFLTSGTALANSISLSGAAYTLNFTGASLLIDGAELNGASIYVADSFDQLFRQVNLFLVDTASANVIRTADTGNLTFDSTTAIDSSAQLLFQADNSASEIRIQGDVTTGTNAVQIVGAGDVIFESGVNQDIIMGVGTTGGNLVISNSTAFTHDKVFSSGGGTSTITKQGGGAFTVTGANTYTGDLIVEGGSFSIGNGGTTGTWAGAIENNSNLIFNRSNAYTYGSAITGTGLITKQGAGALTLSGNVNAGSGIDVENGSLFLTGSSLSTSGITVDIGANVSADADLFGSTNIANSGNVTVTGDASGSDTYSGAISGTGEVEVSSGSNVTFSGTNTYSGITTLRSNARLNVAPTSVNGNVVVNPGASINFNTGGTYDGQISGSGGLEKSGSGTLELTNTNTYSGTTTISGGTLKAEANNSFSGTSDILLNAGTLDFSTFTNSVQSVAAANGTTISSSGAVVNVSAGVTFAGNAEFTGFGTFDSNFSSATSGAGAINATGGTLTLGSATRSNTMNAFSGSLNVGGQTVNILTSDSNARVAADVSLSGGTLSSNRNLVVTSEGSVVGNGTITNQATVDGATVINGNVGSGLEFAGGLIGDADLAGTIVVAGTYRPFDGASAGPITVENLDVSGATVVLDLSSGALPRNAWSATPTFPGAALLANSGTVDITGTNIVFTASTLAGTYKLFGDNTQVVGSFASVTLPDDGRQWTFNETDFTLAVPEPSSFALIFGLLALGFTQTRKPRR